MLDDPAINWTSAPWETQKKPVPAVNGIMAQEARKALEAMQSPIIGKGEIAALLYRLQGHYWQPNMTDKLARSVAEDYIRLLEKSQYPRKVFMQAYDAYLLNPENKFFPKVGELKELLDTKLAAYRWRRKKLEALLGKGFEHA